MSIREYQYCGLVCWSPLGMHVERITYDPTFFERMKPTFDEYFKCVILPRILRDSDKETSEVDVYCRYAKEDNL